MLTATLLLQIIATSASVFMCVMTILGAINWIRKNKKNKKVDHINELKYNIAFIENELTDLRNKPIDPNDKIIANVINNQINAREKQLAEMKAELDKLTK